REVVIGRREQESLADEAVDLELGHLTRQGQTGRCSGTLCEKSEGRDGEDEAHLRRPTPFGAEPSPSNTLITSGVRQQIFNALRITNVSRGLPGTRGEVRRAGGNSVLRPHPLGWGNFQPARNERS